MNLKIKANEPLFDEWNRLGLSIQSMKSIVQNDMEIDEEDYFEWYKLAREYQEKLSKLLNRTLKYVESQNLQRFQK